MTASTPSAASLTLQQLARQVAELLDPRHQATVLLGGSAARGLADDHSDLDLFVITPGVIPSAERHAWLRRVAEPGTLFLDQPVRTGGLADTARAKGRDLTLCYRRAAAVEAAVAELYRGQNLAAEHEMAYGHELLAAQVLADPLGLAAAWRATLAGYPAGRAERVAAAAAAWLAAAGTADEALAAARLYPAAVWVLRRACAEGGCFYPGPKRLRGLLPADLVTRIEDPLASAGPLSARLAALGARGECGAAERPEATPAEQLFNVGADAVGGRLLVAAARRDVLGFAHYAHRALDAWCRLGEAPGPLLAVWQAGLAPERLPAAQRELAAAWVALAARARPGLVSDYARAALQTAVRGLRAG